MAFAELVAQMDRTAQKLLGGVAVIYRPEFGVPVSVVGIFDAAYVRVQGDAEAGVEALGPAVFLILADLPTDPMVDDPTLTINGADYRVIERKPAEFGSIVLLLRLVT